MANGLGALLKKQNQQPVPTVPGTVAESAGAVTTPQSEASADTPIKEPKDEAKPVKKFAFGSKAAGAQSSATTPEPEAKPAPETKPLPRLARFGAGIAVAAEPAVNIDARTDDSERGNRQGGGSVDFDLAGLDINGIDDPRSSNGGRVSGFADETPATAPIRDLPADLTEGQTRFVDSLDGLYAADIIHDPELMGSLVRAMMIELKGNPAYKKLVTPSDVRMAVRTARESMGVVRVKKEAAKAKRAGGGSRSKVLDSDVMSALDSLGLDI